MTAAQLQHFGTSRKGDSGSGGVEVQDNEQTRLCRKRSMPWASAPQRRLSFEVGDLVLRVNRLSVALNQLPPQSPRLAEKCSFSRSIRLGSLRLARGLR
jgi:hypothetical protein